MLIDLSGVRDYRYYVQKFTVRSGFLPGKLRELVLLGVKGYIGLLRYGNVNKESIVSFYISL